MPAALMSSAAGRCRAPYNPEDEKISLFGLAFAYSTNSFSVLKGCWSLTTSTNGPSVRRAIGMKSARVNFGARPNRASTAAKPDIEGRCASSVYPSGLALAANCAPTAPAAPDLVSTTTGCFSNGSSAAANGRPTTSTAPPGGNGLTSVTGRDG